MSSLRKEFSPELVAEARRLYEQTMTPIHEIAAMMGICRGTLHDRIHAWKWVRRSTRQPAADFADATRARIVSEMTAPETMHMAPATPHNDAALAERRAQLAARVLDSVERQLNAIDAVAAKLGPADGAEAERTARALASLARGMHEIAALMRPKETKTPNDSDDDPIPVDIDELRLDLARRIRGLIAEEEREEETESAGEAAGEPA